MSYHACKAQTICWLWSTVVVAIIPPGIGHNRSSSYFVQSYLLGSGLSRSSNWNHELHFIRICHSPLKRLHSTHRSSSNCKQTIYSQKVKQLPLNEYHIFY